MNNINPTLIEFFIGFFGLMLGSFISLVSYRLPVEEDIIFKSSNCPNCHNKLKIFDLIPLFSWLFNFGKCTHCKQPISPRYPLIEIFCCLITLFIYQKFGLTFIAALYLMIALNLLVIIITDIEHYIIPDSIQIILAILALIRAWYLQIDFGNLFLASFLASFLGLILQVSFKAIRKKDGLGMGDVKFLAVAGLYLGTSSFSIFFFIAGIIGVATSLLWRLLNKGALFPFGPALVIAMICCLLVPGIEYQFSSLVENLALKLVNTN